MSSNMGGNHLPGHLYCRGMVLRRVYAAPSRESNKKL
jgi:hypothetical protein